MFFDNCISQVLLTDNFKEEDKMVDAKLYSSVGDCRNTSTVCDMIRIKCSSMTDATNTEICRRLEADYDVSKETYFNDSYSELTAKHGARYLWIALPFTDDAGGALYVQFVNSAGTWIGAFVGTPKGIIDNTLDKFPVKACKKKLIQRHLVDFLLKHKAASEMKISTEPTKTQKPVVISMSNIGKTLVKSADVEKKVETVEPEVKSCAVTTDANTTKVNDKISGAVATSESDEDEAGTVNENEIDFYKTFYDNLLVKVGWSPVLLKSYLTTMTCRLNYLLGENRAGEYIIEAERSQNNKYYVLVNTALLNTLGRPITMLVGYFDRAQKQLYTTCRGWKICDSKKTAVMYGFTKEALSKQLPVVKYYNNSPDELVFKAELDDFDMENARTLEHCIERQIERTHRDMSQVTKNQIYTNITQAVQNAVAISKYDTSYVKPMYSRSNNCIMFVIPYHTDGHFDAAPDMGILVSKDAYGFWQILTVLEACTVKMDCNSLIPYRDSSF